MASVFWKQKNVEERVCVSSWLNAPCFCVCVVVFSAPKAPEPQHSWSDIASVSSSIWDVASSESLHSWPSSSSSPTAPTAVRACICLLCQYFHLLCCIYRTSSFFFFLFQSLLGNTSNPWSTTTPFGNSIWSTSADSALNPFPATTNSTALPDLVSGATTSPTVSAEMSRTYNPWNMWRPTLSRRNLEPWPNSSDNGNWTTIKRT